MRPQISNIERADVTMPVVQRTKSGRAAVDEATRTTLEAAGGWNTACLPPGEGSTRSVSGEAAALIFRLC